jgi:uncharacterized protein YndB with AHSA1/START domain
MIDVAKTILPADKPQIITTRLLSASRELVWKVLTSPEHIKHFWGPDGFTNTIAQMDVKPGGQWLFTMHGPDGKDWPNRIIYRDVKAPVYLSWHHDGGEDNPDGHRFFGELELFEEGSKTRIELRMTESSIAARDAVAQYAVAGGIQNLERLAAYVAPLTDAKNSIVLSRSFPVSQQRLFKACTSVEDLNKWFAPEGFEVIKAEMDFRPGGFYHYGLRGNGVEMWGKQYFKEVTMFSRVVMAHTFSNKDGGLGNHPMSATWPQVTHSIYDFISEGPEQTKWQITWIYSGVDDVEAETFRAAHAGINQGWTGTLDKLYAYLSS